MKPLTLLILLLVTPPVLAQQVPADDHEGVYRLHPDMETVRAILVPPAEVKPGFVYNYYHAGLKQRVWGLALEGGKFEYAFGEGTTIPTSKFDLRLTPEMQARVLDERAPRLLKELDAVGRTPAVRLDGAGNWELLRFPSSSRVFDMATGQRWEWHGMRRLAVLHTYGNLWHVVDGEYYPVTVMMPTYACR
jgi:hypothetical protein